MSNPKLMLAIVTLCSACGSSFVAGGSGGAGGSSADAGAPDTTGGDTGAAGAPTDAGAPSAGAAGHSSGGAPAAGAGGRSTGGSSAGGSSAGAGTGGHTTGGAGGSSAGAGGSAGADCTALKTDYTTALEKARVCDKASTTQCDTGSTLPAIGCGCPVLVNSKSEATTLAKQKYQAYQDAKCNVGPICNIACLAYTSAACSQQTMGSGNVFLCTGSQGVPVP
jgi:hypothetical protein